MGHSPWGHKESDRTKRLTLSLSFPLWLQRVGSRSSTRDGTLALCIESMES